MKKPSAVEEQAAACPGSGPDLCKGVYYDFVEIFKVKSVARSQSHTNLRTHPDYKCIFLTVGPWGVDMRFKLSDLQWRRPQVYYGIPGGRMASFNCGVIN